MVSFILILGFLVRVVGFIFEVSNIFSGLDFLGIRVFREFVGIVGKIGNEWV